MKYVAALIVLLLSGALCSCSPTDNPESAEIIAFADGADPMELVLIVAARPADGEGIASVVSQSEDQVVVRAAVDRPPYPVEDVRVHVKIPISLDAPLGDRDLVDAEGQLTERE